MQTNVTADNNTTSNVYDVLQKMPDVIHKTDRDGNKVLDKNGNPIVSKIYKTIGNFLHILRNDNFLKGAISHNDLTDTTEIVKDMGWNRDVDSMTDMDESNIKAYIEKNYMMLRSKDAFNDATRIVANENSFNPVKDEIEAIEWDGKERIHNLFTRYLGVKRSILTDEASMLIFVGGIARTYEPGVKFEYMPCIVGGQGCGKSTLIRFIAMKDKWFSDDIRNLSDDKIYERLRGHFIVEMAKMIATANSKSVEEIKAFISRQAESYRFPYDKYSIDRPRRFICIGSTNNMDFLPMDKTGNRRFIPLLAGEVECIHPLTNEEECRAYIRQCWAEALAKYKSGDYTLDLSAEAKAMLNEVQKEYTPEDTRIGEIQAWLDTNKSIEYVCSKMIYENALGKVATDMKSYDAKDIASIMDNAITGWSRCGQHRFNDYGQQRAWKYTPEVVVPDVESDIDTDMDLPFGVFN